MEEQGEMMERILLTGATGFIGRAVLHRLSRRPDVELRLLVHRREPADLGPAATDLFKADLARPESLTGITEGIDRVLHLGVYVGEDEQACEEVNGRGTEVLVGEACKSGAKRIVYVSNAAVYGYAIHRNASETEVRVDPATPISRSRVRAERAVLQAGGIVLRPLFIYGEGDNRFLSVIIQAMERFPFMINKGRARLSVISVDDLADILVTLATGAWTADHRGVFHANDGQPVTFRDIAISLSQCVGSRPPAFSLPFTVAQDVLLRFGRGLFSQTGRGFFGHRIFLVSQDHFYDSRKLGALVSAKPVPSLPQALPRYASWYRQFLRPDRRAE